jgi:DNA ligase D-like protein (predicted 3'-phosphoesterase)
MEGVLKSWAVPKGPPLQAGVRRLAMEVDDHSLEYGSFEGTIPEGRYGAGKVKIWDRGDYTLIEKTAKLIRFALLGTKLRGEYALVLMDEEKREWLLLKRGQTGRSGERSQAQS